MRLSARDNNLRAMPEAILSRDKRLIQAGSMQNREAVLTIILATLAAQLNKHINCVRSIEITNDLSTALNTDLYFISGYIFCVQLVCHLFSFFRIIRGWISVTNPYTLNIA